MVTNSIAPFVLLMHEAETVGIVRSVRFLRENTIGQFFGEVSEICDGSTAAVYYCNYLNFISDCQ